MYGFAFISCSPSSPSMYLHAWICFLHLSCRVSCSILVFVFKSIYILTKRYIVQNCLNVCLTYMAVVYVGKNPCLVICYLYLLGDNFKYPVTLLVSPESRELNVEERLMNFTLQHELKHIPPPCCTGQQFYLLMVLLVRSVLPKHPQQL